MAFDLNKNDGSVKDGSNKTPSISKFDLTKGEAAATAASTPSSGSKIWMIALAGILIIGGGIWYYSAHTDTADIVNSASTAVAVKSSGDTVVAGNKIKSEDTINNIGPTTADSSTITVTRRVTSAAGNPDVNPGQSKSIIDNAVVARLNNKIPATFAQGSSSFSSIDKSLIRKITTYLSENADASVQVNGYASSDGSLAINQTISQARADAFKQYLISKSITENRIVAIGRGIEHPIASNDTNAGRKKNRRVEITFP